MKKIENRELLFRILLVVGSLLFLLISLETGFRIYYRHDYSLPSHRNIIFKKSWDAEHVTLNSRGYRDNEVSFEKPDDIVRILAVGDSFTFGEGVEVPEDVFTEILEKKLNTKNNGIRYEVLNTAKKGWSILNYEKFIREDGLSYNPDIVMIGFFINDIEIDQSGRPNK